MQGLKSRTITITTGATLVGAFMLYAFWPRPIQIDMATVSRGPMTTTINEEAKTRVHDAFVITAPISGRLLRVEADAGDEVIAGETVIAQITPTNPSLLDVRTEEQARAAIETAQAALAFAQAEAKKARADADYARLERDRQKQLRDEEFVAQAVLDRAERAWRAAAAAVETAEAAIRMREADLENAELALLTYGNEAANDEAHTEARAIPIQSPTSGRVLRVFQKSESVIQAGTPIVEVGDPLGDLEIVAELLTTDAVRIARDNEVIIEKWGGDEPLHGVVERIEPWGFTKISALGVEEQRTNVIIQFTCSPEDHRKLGHGYRVETRIVTWASENTLRSPSNAFFRHDGKWAVFRIVNGRARLTTVELGHNSGVQVEILDGLEEGDEVILYPGALIRDGARVRQRQTS